MVFVVFWSAMVFGSIAWYAFLLFYVGWKGGREIFAMVQRLRDSAARSDVQSDRPH